MISSVFLIGPLTSLFALLDNKDRSQAGDFIIYSTST